MLARKVTCWLAAIRTGRELRGHFSVSRRAADARNVLALADRVGGGSDGATPREPLPDRLVDLEGARTWLARAEARVRLAIDASRADGRIGSRRPKQPHRRRRGRT